MNAYQTGGEIVVPFPTGYVRTKLRRHTVRFCPTCGEQFADLFAYQCPHDYHETVKVAP